MKPVEHSNEYGINLGGPLVPFGSWKHKLFYFTNYNGFRYSSSNPTPMRFPTNAERTGDFSADGVAIYDPATQAACTANSTNGPCRYQYGYMAGVGTGASGQSRSEWRSGQSRFRQRSFRRSQAICKPCFRRSPSTSTGNNYTAPNFTGLINWSTTSRIDYVINSRDTISLLAAIGRQASSVPAGQTSSGRNVGPVPYNYGQSYAPKTAVWTLEETHVFSPNLINQLKYGYAYYSARPSIPPIRRRIPHPLWAFQVCRRDKRRASSRSRHSPAPMRRPIGAAPTTTPATAVNYTVLDNVQWNFGKHSFTFGGQIAWLLYNNLQPKGGSTPVTLANAVTETSGIVASTTFAEVCRDLRDRSGLCQLPGGPDRQGQLYDNICNPSLGPASGPFHPTSRTTGR